MARGGDVSEQERAWMVQLRQMVMLEVAVAAAADLPGLREEPMMPTFRELRRKR